MGVNNRGTTGARPDHPLQLKEIVVVEATIGRACPQVVRRYHSESRHLREASLVAEHEHQTARRRDAILAPVKGWNVGIFRKSKHGHVVFIVYIHADSRHPFPSIRDDDGVSHASHHFGRSHHQVFLNKEPAAREPYRGGIAGIDGVGLYRRLRRFKIAPFRKGWRAGREEKKRAWWEGKALWRGEGRSAWAAKWSCHLEWPQRQHEPDQHRRHRLG